MDRYRQGRGLEGSKRPVPACRPGDPTAHHLGARQVGQDQSGEVSRVPDMELGSFPPMKILQSTVNISISQMSKLRLREVTLSLA